MTIGPEIAAMSRAARRRASCWALCACCRPRIDRRTRHLHAPTCRRSCRARRRATQHLLVEQLREGPAARLLIAAVDGGDAASRAQLSATARHALRAEPQFASVSNGDAASRERDREFLFGNRYLLSDAVTPEHFSVAGLHEAIAAALDELASPQGAFVKELFTRDPTGELLHILDALGGTERAPIRARASSAARRHAGAARAADARRRLRHRCTAGRGRASARAFAAARGSCRRERRSACASAGRRCSRSNARALIKREVMRLSLISAGLIALLLLTVYRSPPALVLGLVPVASGALAGVAAVALGFGAVHGITLGFGVTLIGESVDYSIYLFVQRNGATGAGTLWPTLRLGVLTSIAGFAVAAAVGLSRARAARPVLDRRAHRRRARHPLRAAGAGSRASFRIVDLSEAGARLRARARGAAAGAGRASRRRGARRGAPLHAPRRRSSTTSCPP